jgi:hypothetical protein
MTSLRRMFTVALGWPEPAWLTQADLAWRDPAVRAGDPAVRAGGAAVRAGGAAVRAGGAAVRAAIPIWRDPWMVVGSATFAGDIAARLGLDNVYGTHPERYPHVSLDDLAARRPELIVLPDEPYRFSAGDGPEMFPRHRVALVTGRDLTWYGPSLITARARLLSQLAAARPALS